jgi:hypothetical protein
MRPARRSKASTIVVARGRPSSPELLSSLVVSAGVCFLVAVASCNIRAYMCIRTCCGWICGANCRPRWSRARARRYVRSAPSLCFGPLRRRSTPWMYSFVNVSVCSRHRVPSKRLGCSSRSSRSSRSDMYTEEGPYATASVALRVRTTVTPPVKR